MSMQSIADVRQISAQELAMMGVQNVAYVKPVIIDGAARYAIHAADGTQMAVVANRDVAFMMVRQNDLDPVSVH
jgi:hypothetical protein